ncbi:hypothetical protein ACQEU3_39180 [Spirillospora sp. CA-253888]
MTGEEPTEEICRVCGLDDQVFWEDGWPTNAICSCCGTESDVDQNHADSVRHLRGYWLGAGAVWRSPSQKPKDWNILEQVANIPPRWR